MHALAIFDKTFDHFWFESKVYHILLKSKMAFDSRQKWSKIWWNMAFDTFDICQRRGAKAIFRAVCLHEPGLDARLGQIMKSLQ